MYLESPHLIQHPLTVARMILPRSFVELDRLYFELIWLRFITIIAESIHFITDAAAAVIGMMKMI